MADHPAPTWKQAIDAALKENNGTPKPKSLRALAKALVNQAGSNQNEESWQSTLKKVRRENKATERVASLIAAALEVPRDQLPATQKLSVQARVGRLEGDVDELIRIVKATERILESLGVEPVLLDEVRFALDAREAR